MAATKPSVNHLAAAVLAVTAALGSYEAVASGRDAFASTSIPAQQSAAPAMSAFELAHRDAMKKLRASTLKFAEINKRVVARGFPAHMLSDEESTKLAFMMLGIRQIEASVKSVSVNGDAKAFHAELRRAVADLRSEIVVTFEMLRQIRGTPEHTSGRVEMDGLKALADHSTDRLLELASA